MGLDVVARDRVAKKIAANPFERECA